MAPAEDSPPCSQSELRWVTLPGRPGLERAVLGPRTPNVEVGRLDLSPGGRWAVALEDMIRVWDVQCGGLRSSLRLPLGLTKSDVRVSPRGDRIAFRVDDAISITDFEEGVVDPHPRSLGSLKSSSRLTFSPDGTRLLVLGSPETRLIDAEDGHVLARLLADDVTDGAFATDGSFVAVATHDSSTPPTLRLCDGHSLTAVKSVSAPFSLHYLVFARDGAKIYALGSEHMPGNRMIHHVVAYDVPSLSQSGSSFEIPYTSRWSEDLAPVPGGKLAAITGEHILLWAPPARTPVLDIEDVHDEDATAIVFSPKDPNVFVATVQGQYEVAHAEGPQPYVWRIKSAPAAAP
jgi:WD40 repeat protein